jgi:hypothetical protein
MYYIKYLDMFRAILCSFSGGQNCILQHLVSSLSVSGRAVHRFSFDRSTNRLSLTKLNSIMMLREIGFNFLRKLYETPKYTLWAKLMLLNVQFTRRTNISLRDSKCMVNNRTPREKGRALGFRRLTVPFPNITASCETWLHLLLLKVIDNWTFRCN